MFVVGENATTSQVTSVASNKFRYILSCKDVLILSCANAVMNLEVGMMQQTSNRQATVVVRGGTVSWLLC